MALFLIYDGLKFRDILPYLVTAVIAVRVTIKYLQAKGSPLNDIPTVGHSGFLTSYITAFRWMRHGGEVIQQGYNQYRGRPFKVATISKWVVILSGKELVEDLVSAPESVASLRQGVTEAMHVKYTLQRKPGDDCYHIVTIRGLLTRHLVSKFDEIRDEIVESFAEYIPLAEGADWTAVPAYQTLMRIVCRANNRYFIGLPLCRDTDYCSLNERFTIDVAIGARIINFFPDILKPLAGKYLTRAPSNIEEAIRYLGPIIEERLAQERQHGPKWPGRPNDLISWLLDTATQDYNRTVRDLAIRILTINFSSIHTTTMATTQTLYDIAIHPEYVDEMREEAEKVTGEHGWTKVAMQKLHKIDSFLKESQRLNSLGSMLMTYKILQDWVTSDGTLIPAGTSVGVANDATNKDEATFPDAHKFNGFRFVNKQGDDGESESAKHQMVSVAPDYLVFGYGRHACPGRFFAISEIKSILAHILLNYDVQLENGSRERPPNFMLETSTIPSTKTKVMFRKIRKTSVVG